MPRELTVHIILNDDSDEIAAAKVSEMYTLLGASQKEGETKPALEVTAIANSNLFKRMELIEEASATLSNSELAEAVREIISLPDNKLAMVAGLTEEGELIYQKTGHARLRQ